MLVIENEVEASIKGDKRGRFPNVFITSDLHYNHRNICRASSEWRDADGNVPVERTRDYPSLGAMNEVILSGINNTVGPDDILIVAGDLALGDSEGIHDFLSKIVTKKRYLVYGNHDTKILDNDMNLKSCFQHCFADLKLKIGKYKFVISHYPHVSWRGMSKGHFHLFGHVHLPTHLRFGPGRCMDIGFEGHPEKRPYHIVNECVPLLDPRPIKSWFNHDHHTPDYTK